MEKQQQDLALEDKFPPELAERFLENLSVFVGEDEDSQTFTEEELGWGDWEEILEEMSDEEEAEVFDFRKPLETRLAWVEQARGTARDYEARRKAYRPKIERLTAKEIIRHPALRVANFRELECKVEELPREELLEIILDYELDEEL